MVVLSLVVDCAPSIVSWQFLGRLGSSKESISLLFPWGVVRGELFFALEVGIGRRAGILG